MMPKWAKIAVAVLALAAYLWWDGRRADLTDAKFQDALRSLNEVKASNEQFREYAKSTIESLHADNEAKDRRIAVQDAKLRDSEARVGSLLRQLDSRLREIEKATVPELKSSWAVLVDLPLPEFNGGPICLSEAAARVTVATLERGRSAGEQVRELEGQKAALTQTVKEQGGIIANKDGELVIERERNTRQVTETEAERKVAQAELAAVKAKARRSKMKWFLAGIGGGIVLVVTLGH